MDTEHTDAEKLEKIRELCMYGWINLAYLKDFNEELSEFGKSHSCG